MIYTERDINLANICLIKIILNDKKVRGGVSKEHIVKNDKNKKNHCVLLLSNKENKKKLEIYLLKVWSLMNLLIYL